MELSTSTSKSSQLSIPLTLRIGITGSRSLEAVQLQRVRSEAASFLKAVRGIALDLTSSPTVRPLYAIGDTSNSSAQLWLLSALAEGSDRVVAEVALNEGFSLHSPLPFSREEYENDFHSDESRQEFRDLLRRAEPYILELDGARGNAQGSSYRAAGRFIVRNCDLLIAVWDGRLAKGPGGTGEIVEFAVERGLPVWWINVDEDATPTWVVGWNDSPLVADTSEHSTPLRTYLTELISPPKEVEAAPHTLFERVAKWGQKSGAPKYASLTTPISPSDWWVWKAYGWSIRALAAGGRQTEQRWTAPISSMASHWRHYHAAAANKARKYANRYRSSYVWVFGLAAIGLSLETLSPAMQSTAFFEALISGVELICLLLIAALVLANQRQGWHSSFIEHRLFAELCRKQAALSLLGWNLPGLSIPARTLAFERDVATSIQRASWVGWLFGALQRAAPMRSGAFSTVEIADVQRFALDELIAHQLTYHSNRATEMQRASDRLGQWGEWLFILLVVMVALKITAVGLHNTHAVTVLSTAAALLPAWSAAFVGLRAYSELSLLADQSRRIVAALTLAKRRVQNIVVDSPLASERLGLELSSVTTIMLQDIEGWVQLLSGKTLEPG